MIIYTQMLDAPADKHKFERLYKQYRALMYHIAFGILRSEQDAEDAVHQAFVSILENFEKIFEVECPKTRAFCVIVVERKALNMLRERRKLADGYDVELSGVSVPPPDGAPLAAALARLPARYREALLLRYYMGYSAKEVAGILGLSHSNASKLIWRAKQALQTLLEGGPDTNE